MSEVKHLDAVDRVYREVYHDGEFDVVVATSDEDQSSGEFVSVKSFGDYCGLTGWEITTESMNRGYFIYMVGRPIGGACLRRDDFERVKVWCIREGMKKAARKSRAKRKKRKA